MRAVEIRFLSEPARFRIKTILVDTSGLIEQQYGVL